MPRLLLVCVSISKILTLVCKARNGLCPSFLADLLHAYVRSRTLRSSDMPTLAIPNFKLKTVGDRSFYSAGPRLWNSLPHSFCAGALACSDATPGTVAAVLRLHLLATHCGASSYDQSLLLFPCAVEMILQEREDSS